MDILEQIQEIVDLKNESFVCNKVPQFPQKVLGAAGGLIQGNIPLICGGYNGYLPKDDYKKCYALKNKKWKHVTNLHEARQFMGSGKLSVSKKYTYKITYIRMYFIQEVLY